jgi:purine-nucleoside phosphorylase
MTKETFLQTTEYLKTKGIENPEIGIILGTGLGQLVNNINILQTIDYKNIPNFPIATVEFHSGKLIYGILENKKVLVMQGRFHLYEGYTLEQVTYPIRIMHTLGIKNLLVSNAAGGIHANFKKGDIMLLDDHINLQGGSPLAFKNVGEFGERFVDMLAPYNTHMNQLLIDIAKENNINMHLGTYAAVVGPQLETRAEYRFLKTIGADAVGMSTVPEIIVANHLKLPVIAVSVITDECNPDNLKPIDIAEIIRIAAETEPKMIKLFTELIKKI